MRAASSFAASPSGKGTLSLCRTAYGREKAIADNRQKPRLRISPPKSVKAAIGTQYCLLNDVVGIRRRTREPARKIVGRVEVRQHLRLKPAAPVIHASNGWLYS